MRRQCQRRRRRMTEKEDTPHTHTVIHIPSVWSNWEQFAINYSLYRCRGHQNGIPCIEIIIIGHWLAIKIELTRRRYMAAERKSDCS